MSKFYMPELGIFLSRDFLPYLNKYRAFSNDPVNQVDNDGLAPESPNDIMSRIRQLRERIAAAPEVAREIIQEEQRLATDPNATPAERELIKGQLDILREKVQKMQAEVQTLQQQYLTTVKSAQELRSGLADVESRIKLSVQAANKIFKKCKIRINLVRFEDFSRNPQLADVAKGVNEAKTLPEKLALLTRLIQHMARQQKPKGDVGFLVTDLTAFGRPEGGFSAADPAKTTVEGNLIKTQKGGFIGDVLLSSKNMTPLTLAQELRDRLAFEDVNKKGQKLRHGSTKDLIKDNPNSRLETLCDDECVKLRNGLKKSGIVKGKLDPNKEYTINIYVAHLPFGTK